MSAVVLCQGTALALPLRDASVHCVVTSPPYWGLRKYDCGPGELGMEPSPDAYVDAMVQVFREVRRVLRNDGTLWCNVGDVYTSGNRDSYGPLTGKNVAVKIAPRPAQPLGLAAKNLLGMPWRLAFALQADGWILRSEIIWSKLNPMPESVQDRVVRSHEQVFLFSKQARYFYDATAVAEPSASPVPASRLPSGTYSAMSGRNDDGRHRSGGFVTDATRACRSVWSLASEPFSGSHFATFPTALVRRCLLAGAPTQVCAACGKAWVREVERTAVQPYGRATLTEGKQASWKRTNHGTEGDNGHWRPPTTTGFTASCACAAGVTPSVVFDPFCGSGTTLLVARELGHHAVGIDLSYQYLSTIARTRLGLAQLAAWTGDAPAPAPAVIYDDLPLFGGF